LPIIEGKKAQKINHKPKTNMQTPATAQTKQLRKRRGFRSWAIAATLLFLLSMGGTTWAQPNYVITTTTNSTGFTPNTSQDIVLGYLPTVGGPVTAGYQGGGLTLGALTDGFAPAGPYTGYWFEIQTGNTLTFNIGAPSSISSIESCSTWNDNGRCAQQYTVDVSTDGITWTTGFITVPSQPGAGKPADVDVLITPASGASLLTNNVQYLRFNFPTVENGWVAYTEFVINGTVSVPPGPPSIAIVATNLVVTNTTTNVTFSAVASGYPPASMTWHFVDTNGVDWTLPETATNITIPIVSPTDAGGYYAVATSSQGSTSSTTNILTVITPASQPVVQTVYSLNTGFDPLNTNGDLLLGLTDPYTPQPVLTDGSDANGSVTAGNYVSLGGGAVQTFDLYAPCDIYEIDTYSASPSSANANGIYVDQNYVVSVSSDNGNTYSNLYAAKARLSLLYASSSSPVDMDVKLTPNNGGTVLASNVDHIRFTFNNDAEQPNLQVYNFELMAYGINKRAPGLPTITTDVPASVQAIQSTSLSIAVAVLGNPIPTFQWYNISGGATNAIPGATNSTYAIAQVQPTNAGLYQVVISNPYGSVTSAVSKVVFYGVTPVTNTIYKDTFSRVGPLIGSAPSPVNAGNAAWVGWTPLNTDGSELALTNATPTGGAAANAFLPFTPQRYHIYTLSCDIEPIAGGNQWLALGFALTPATNNYFAGVTIGVDWCLVRGSDANFQIFAGPGGGQIGGNWPAPGNTNVFGTFSLVLDTTTGNASSGWSMAVYTNGVLVVATNNVWSPNPAIQYVGLGADAATGNFRNFTLTDLNYEVIPAALSVTGQPGSQVLSWPSIYLGWILQSNSVGLQARNAWVTVPGSTATTQMPLTVNQNQSAVFYRLLAP
jgi:hypothetical protein